jgi:hypothetical protein
VTFIGGTVTFADGAVMSVGGAVTFVGKGAAGGRSLRQLELGCTVAGQVAEVYMSLAAMDPWLWLRKRVKLAELARAELARTGLAWAELARTELAQAELL